MWRISVAFLLAFVVVRARSENDSFREQVRGVLSALGIEQTVDVVSSSIAESVRNAQRYNKMEFGRDWNRVSSEPGIYTAFSFARNATFPSFVKTIELCGAQLQYFHGKMMNFLRSKCDVYIGKDAPFHPWNLMKQDRESVAFVLFLSASAFTVIFFHFYTIHNMLIIVAGSFLMYSLGGPHWCLRFLLFLVAICWFVFDLVMMYPFRFAIGVLLYFAVTSLLPRFSADTPEFDINSVDIPELDTLSNRVHGVERQTNAIQKKIDKLTDLIEQLRDDGI